MTIDNLRFIDGPTPKNTDLEISVVIPTLFRPYQVLSLLQSISGQRDAPRTEILVVSNLEDPTLCKLLLQADSFLSPTALLTVGTIGANAARNLGLERAVGQIVLFIDDDCELRDPLFLRKHFDLHAQHPEASAIGGRYALPERSSALSRAYHLTANHWLDRSLRTEHRTQHLLGGNSSFKAECVKGETAKFRFDEQIQFGGSETELQLRMAAAGHKLFLFENLELVHHCKINLSSLIRKGYLQGRTSKRLDSLRAESLKHHLNDSTDGFPKQTQSLPLSLGTRFGLWAYRHSFEQGEQDFALGSNQRPRLIHWLARAIRTELALTLQKKVFPLMREGLYVARINFENRKKPSE